MSNTPLHPIRDTHAVEEHVNAAWESYSSPPHPAIQFINLEEELQTATTELSMNIDDLFVLLWPTVVNATSAERLELYLAVIIIRFEKIKMIRFENRAVLKKEKLLDNCTKEAVSHLGQAITELQHHMDVMVRSIR